MLHRGRRILISVTDKSGIEKFGVLTEHGWEIVSTGGTAAVLQMAGVPCTLVETITKFPEMLDGRVKTLHPAIFGGILADRSKPAHMDAIDAQGIGAVDVVVVNLYAFLEKPGIENIDIGGPSLLRAAAKNALSVVVLVDPADYDRAIGELATNGSASEATREELAIKVFQHTAAYDVAIAAWMTEQLRLQKRFLQGGGTTH